MNRPQPVSSATKASRKFRVGTRGSRLALRQTEEVLDQLRAIVPQLEFDVVTIKTGGDAAANVPLAELGLGIFVKELERALLDGEIDMAVHSLKDLPTQLPDGLIIGAVCKRQDPRDVLVNRWGWPLDQLPSGARIGTGSPRREAQLKAIRQDLEVLPLRGNVDTRLDKANGAAYDGVIIAAAGVIRMGRDAEIAQLLPADDFVPAPGQGALAVEVRSTDDEVIALVSQVQHSPTRKAVTAERAFLEVLGGGCEVPVGAYARIDGDTMVMSVFLASRDGTNIFKSKTMGSASNPHEVALDAHQRVIERGGAALLNRSS